MLAGTGIHFYWCRDDREGNRYSKPTGRRPKEESGKKISSRARKETGRKERNRRRMVKGAPLL